MLKSINQLMKVSQNPSWKLRKLPNKFFVDPQSATPTHTSHRNRTFMNNKSKRMSESFKEEPVIPQSFFYRQNERRYRTQSEINFEKQKEMKQSENIRGFSQNISNRPESWQTSFREIQTTIIPDQSNNWYSLRSRVSRRRKTFLRAFLIVLLVVTSCILHLKFRNGSYSHNTAHFVSQQSDTLQNPNLSGKTLSLEEYEIIMNSGASKSDWRSKVNASKESSFSYLLKVGKVLIYLMILALTYFQNLSGSFIFQYDRCEIFHRMIFIFRYKTILMYILLGSVYLLVNSLDDFMKLSPTQEVFYSNSKVMLLFFICFMKILTPSSKKISNFVNLDLKKIIISNSKVNLFFILIFLSVELTIFYYCLKDEDWNIKEASWSLLGVNFMIVFFGGLVLMMLYQIWRLIIWIL